MLPTHVQPDDRNRSLHASDADGAKSAHTTLLSRLRRLLCQVHASEQGSESIERLLLVGAVAIPVVGFLMMFRSEITNWVTGRWEQVAADESSTSQAFTAP